MTNTPDQNGNSDLKSRHGLKRLRKALSYSYDGLKAASDEAAFRELLVLHAVLMLLLVFITFSLPIKMILVMASCVSLIVELFNTSIEAAVDHTSTEKHPLAKRAKDAGSAAQYVCLSMIAALWFMASIL